MAGVVNHGQGHILVASDISATPCLLFSVANSYMSGHVVHSVHDLRRDVVVALHFIEQVPHGVVIDNDQGGETASVGHAEDGIVNSLLWILFI
jgi:hypothetical protein